MSLLSQASIAVFKLFNYEKLTLEHANNPKKGIKIYPITIDKKILIESILAEVTTNGISCNTWENGGKAYSLGIRLSDESYYAHIDELVQKLAEKLPEEFKVTSPVKDEIIYLKLKLKKDEKTFLTKTNIKLTAAKYQEADITRTQEVQAKLEFFSYVDISNQRAGISITAIDLQFIE